MIADVLMQIAILHREVPEDEFDVDDAIDAAIEAVGRDVTEEEREELERVVPEWVGAGAPTAGETDA